MTFVAERSTPDSSESEVTHEDLVTCLRDWATITDEVQGRAALVMLSGAIFAEAADEIERLWAICHDLHHDATCAESFCRLCGEGIKEWEARRG